MQNIDNVMNHQYRCYIFGMICKKFLKHCACLFLSLFLCVEVEDVASGAARNSLYFQSDLLIKSDEIAIGLTDSKITLLGNVSMQSTDITVFADKVFIFFHETHNKMPNAENALFYNIDDFKTIEAYGNCVVTFGDNRLSSDYAHYDAQKTLFTFTKNVKLKSVKSIISAEKITYDPKNNNIQISSKKNHGGVKGVIFHYKK